MLYLNVSNRTENLLLQLAALLKYDLQSDPFAGELFLIQSRGMERLIAQSMADSFSCFANFQFFLPLDCVSYFAGILGVGMSPDGYEREVLTWRIESLLRDIDDEVYAPLRNYLSDSSIERKRFQLARRLAGLFDQYQIMRPEMLTAWEMDGTATDLSAENWQKSLWQRLLAAGNPVHRGSLLLKLIEVLGKPLSGALLPKRLLVFGVHSMPAIFLKFMHSLANHLDVHFYLLSPCRQFWGDMPVSRRVLTGGIAGPERDEFELVHPLLATLGKQGRDFQNMLLSDVEIGREFDSYDEPLSPQEYNDASLLQKIQDDLLMGRLPQPAEGEKKHDGSVVLVSCHSKLRELQVLKDRIFLLLENNRALKLRDIAVMAPDIQDYSGLIPAVFADIQHSIADRSIRGKNPVINAFIKYLELLDGRFGWSELIDFLRLPAVYPGFGLVENDLELIEHWTVQSGIRWGLSGEQRGEAGLPAFPDASWKAGLSRLLVGVAIDSDEFIDGILPYSQLEGRSAVALGAVCRLHDMLMDAWQKTQKQRAIHDWVGVLLGWVEDLFGTRGEQDSLELRTLIADFDEKISVFHQHGLSFEVVADYLRKLTLETRSSSGFLRGQLMFCSMLPMRSIPFKVVCLIGLNDGVFPKNDNRDTFDLMSASFRPGDRSPRSDDRYQFLEAILAARSHLILSYIGQSVKTHEPIPPSVVVTEFVELIEHFYGVADIVISQPLHAFSASYFRTDRNERLVSHNEYSFRTAQALQAGEDESLPWWNGQLPIPDDGVIAVASLLSFWKNPQKYFVRSSLGIILDGGSELPEDRELFEVRGLDKYWADEFILSRVLDRTPPEYRELRARGMWPLGTVGELSFAARMREIQDLAEKIQTLNFGVRLDDLMLDIDTAQGSIRGGLTSVYEKGLLLVRNGDLRGRDVLAGWVQHLLLSAVNDKEKSCTVIASPNETITFSEIPESADLDTFLRYFQTGSLMPSLIFPDAAMIYVQQKNNPRSRKTPLQAAHDYLDKRFGKGFESEWELLFGSCDGLLDCDEFIAFCENTMGAIMNSAARVNW